MKPIEEFGLRSKETGERVFLCRPCAVDYQHRWYVKNRDALVARAQLRRDQTAAAKRLQLWRYLADHQCVDCGETDPVVLEFDHLRDKRANVSQMVSWGFAWATIELEIAKCEVRFVNCHVRKTARALGIYERKHSFRRIEDSFLPYLVAAN